MPEQDNWKEKWREEFDKIVNDFEEPEWSWERKDALQKHMVKMAHKLKHLMSTTLSSQAHALKEQIISERDTQIGKWLQYELKEYKNGCGTCGGILVEIRGRYPYTPKRFVCPTCLMETIESAIDNLYPNNQAYNSEPNLSAIESIEI